MIEYKLWSAEAAPPLSNAAGSESAGAPSVLHDLDLDQLVELCIEYGHVGFTNLPNAWWLLPDERITP